MILNITVNDKSHEVPQSATVADLLKRLEFQPKYVAVERNLELVPRATHADCLLAEGDRIEIVTLVGGG